MEDLLVKTGQGDMRALKSLYESMYSDVFAFTLSILRDPVAAADLTQDTFLRVYEGAPRYQSRGQGKAWILRISKNICLNYLKKQKRVSAVEPKVMESLLGQEDADMETPVLLRTLMQELEAKDRALLMLHAKGYIHKEIATIMGMPEGTVRWRYSKALKRLQKLYGPAEPESGMREQEDSYEAKE